MIVGEVAQNRAKVKLLKKSEVKAERFTALNGGRKSLRFNSLSLSTSPLIVRAYFRADVVMLLSQVRTRPDLTQGDVQRGTFEHAMLGKLYLHPTTANLEFLDDIATGIRLSLIHI